jgi:hypothetical protein
MRNALRNTNPTARIAAAAIITASTIAGLAVGLTDNPLRDLIAALPAHILAVIA